MPSPAVEEPVQPIAPPPVVEETIQPIVPSPATDEPVQATVAEVRWVWLVYTVV